MRACAGEVRWGEVKGCVWMCSCMYVLSDIRESYICINTQGTTARRTLTSLASLTYLTSFPTRTLHSKNACTAPYSTQLYKAAALHLSPMHRTALLHDLLWWRVIDIPHFGSVIEFRSKPCGAGHAVCALGFLSSYVRTTTCCAVTVVPCRGV